MTEDAETIVVTLGSVAGTVKDTVDLMRKNGTRIGVVSICSFRPFPKDQIRAVLEQAKRVVVLEKSFALGFGGIVANNVMMSMQRTGVHVYTAVAGLGGRPIIRTSLTALFEKAGRDELEDVHFLDLDWEVVNRELDRARESITSGPTAENILRDLGPGVAKAV
ncbi:MAG: transketolase C-terminal domain-containing protein [Arenicellales bacterium]|nr:transketolase C-terminal domain-containing protein [Arenicellales bacterium]